MKHSTLNMYNYRQRKREKGLCLYGGCWEPTEGPGLCLTHIERWKQNRRTREEKANAAKL
jgi:hypothetical protein